MKKWMLALSLCVCSLLFFVAGSFLGYLSYAQKAQEQHFEKPQRKPSANLPPILGKIVYTQQAEIMNRIRVPTPSAVIRARQYKEQYVDGK